MRKIFALVVVLFSCTAFAQTNLKVLATVSPAPAPATTHQVALGWTASTSTCSGTLGYNIYRGTAAGQESTTALNTTLISGTTFTDTAVTPLTQYFYTAKTFCSTASPNLSVASNEVSATVPGDPQPLPPVLNTPTAQ